MIISPKIIGLFCILLFPLPLGAHVVRPAPNFTWHNATGSSVNSLASLRRSAVLIITPDVENVMFRAQIREIQRVYQDFAANRGLAFIAFSENAGRVPSNIPFVQVAYGQQTAAHYGVPSHTFGVAIIGRDGNLDYFSNRVVDGQRMMNIINNSFVIQSLHRQKLDDNF